MRTFEDLRYSFRILLKSPGFTTVALICLMLGIGATSAIFSVVNAVLLRPLPYTQPEQLVRLYTEFPTFPGGGLRKFWMSPPEFLDLRREGKAWESVDGWNVNGVNLAGDSEPIRVTSCTVTGGLLRTLGVKPAFGRILSDADDAPGAPLTAVISYGLWQRAFGSNSGIAGRDTQVNGRRCTIVGVMPKGFQFPPGEADPPEIWTPLQLDPAKPGSRASHFMSILGRMKPGVSLAQARDELDRLMAQWGKAAAPKTHAVHPKNHPILAFSFHEEVVGGVRVAMLMLLTAVVFVLMISCVNVANLLLARAEARQREIAIRSAIGAGLWRLVRQFITEGLLLSSAGAVLGLLLAFGGLRLITTSNATGLPRVAEIGIDSGILIFTLLVSVVTGIFFGVAPVAHLIVRNLHESLKSAGGRTVGSTGARAFRRVLVVVELALALVLLIGSGLMVRAFWKLQEVDTGLNPRNLLTMRVNLPRAVYQDNTSVDAFWNRLHARLSALPGVQSAALMSGLPPARRLDANDTEIEGFVRVPNGPGQNVDFYQIVSRGYFETAGIRLIEGRFFQDGDGPGAPNVAIINHTMARMHWPNQSAIGHRIRPSFRDPWCTIVGVVADVKNAGIDKPTGTEVYLPYRQPQASGNRTAYLLLRTAGDPAGMASPVRREIHALDASLPVASVRSMDEVLSSVQSRPRFLTLLLTLFSTVALVLAAVGLYGVISYSVAQRTSEIGIRVSMGAQPADVLKLILGQGLRLGVIGVAAGGAGAILLTRLMRGLLFGIHAFDPTTFAAMAVVLLAVVVLASYVPARRATKIDPMVALRYE